jgi:hypothetical protein
MSNFLSHPKRYTLIPVSDALARDLKKKTLNLQPSAGGQSEVLPQRHKKKRLTAALQAKKRLPDGHPDP